MNLDRLKELPAFKQAIDYDKVNMRDAFQAGYEQAKLDFTKPVNDLTEHLMSVIEGKNLEIKRLESLLDQY
jgi:hypothetical protein